MNAIVLETESLVKRYGSLTAVNHLSLQVYAGEVFGFLGPNGAGKTTAINMLCGLLEPDGGRVLVNGKPIRNGSDEVRARVGVCPQAVVLWERLTCIEQLEFIGQMYGMHGGAARQRGSRLLEELDLSEKRDKTGKNAFGRDAAPAQYCHGAGARSGYRRFGRA